MDRIKSGKGLLEQIGTSNISTPTRLTYEDLEKRLREITFKAPKTMSFMAYCKTLGLVTIIIGGSEDKFNLCDDIECSLCNELNQIGL